MPRSLSIAAVQMIGHPAPTESRLARAAEQIKAAAAEGAQLIVLPELFNTGYSYGDENYEQTETAAGITLAWMQAQAAEQRVYLCGSLLLKEADHVYNAAFLIAPDGAQWRYDKQYPFLWERAFFREGNRISIAETDFGRVGLMICWDAAHADVWARYAGQVDLVLIPSCPPKFNDAELIFPDGQRRSLQSLGGLTAASATDVGYFPYDIEAQAAWMRVPAVHTAGIGHFESTLTVPLLSVGIMTAADASLWKYLKDAPEVRIGTDWERQTKIINAAGEVVGRVEHDGDGYTLAQIELPDERPYPGYEQPPINTPALTYLNADVIGIAANIPIYQRGLRRRWGAKMAPFDTRTKWWAVGLLIALVVGWLLGRTKR